MKNDPVFTVTVTYADRMWIGVCDDLGLVTEAKTYEQLTKRVEDIAPELCQLNCDIHPAEMRLDFLHEKSIPVRL